MSIIIIITVVVVTVGHRSLPVPIPVSGDMKMDIICLFISNQDTTMVTLIVPLQ